MKVSTIAAVLMFAGSIGVSANSNAEERSIFINGERMNAYEIIALDYLNCGESVPSGRYWINWSSRAWGFEGGRQQGLLSECGGNESAPAESSSEGGGYWEDRMSGNYGIDVIQNPVYK